MANVVIDDSNLSAIGDALRYKLGDTRIEKRYVETIHHPETFKDMKPKIAKTPNAVGFATRNGGYGNNKEYTETVTIEGATSLRIDVAYQTESTSYDYLVINHGPTKYGGTTLTRKSIAVNGDTVTFTFKSDSSNDGYLGYYAEVLGMDANGNILQDVIPPWDEDIYEDVVVNNVFKPRDMAPAIKSMTYQMHYANVTSIDGLSYDLSPYVSDGDDFILFYFQRYRTDNPYLMMSIYTTFFTEEQAKYPHYFLGSERSSSVATVRAWSSDDKILSGSFYQAVGYHNTNYDGVTVTFKDGILKNSKGVGVNAFLVYTG